jgi:hypothetical protein
MEVRNASLDSVHIRSSDIPHYSNVIENTERTQSSQILESVNANIDWETALILPTV